MKQKVHRRWLFCELLMTKRSFLQTPIRLMDLIYHYCKLMTIAIIMCCLHISPTCIHYAFIGDINGWKKNVFGYEILFLRLDADTFWDINHEKWGNSRLSFLCLVSSFLWNDWRLACRFLSIAYRFCYCCSFIKNFWHFCPCKSF